MKVSFDSALWNVVGVPSYAKEYIFDYTADDINAEISKALSWLENELRSAVAWDNALQKIMNCPTRSDTH